MRWVAGHHHTHPPHTIPTTAVTLTDHHIPVWMMGVPPHRSVTTDQAVVTVVGRCAANDTELRAAAEKSLRTRDWSVFTHWAGSYLTVLTTRQESVVVPDLAGIWPLYYTHHDHGWFWATRARPLAQATCAALDVEVLAAHMAAPLVEELRATRSLWHGIHQVPPGHTLHLAHDRATIIAPAPLSGLDPDQVPERLRTALTEAVALRTPESEQVSADLSGGMDSTAIALLAARTTEVYAVTYTTSGLGNHTDLHHARTAAAITPAITHHLAHGGTDTLPYTNLRQITATDTPALDLRAWSRHRAYLTPAAEAGSTVHLTGNGGDNVLSTGPAHLADLLISGHHRRAWTQTLAHARLWRVPVHRLARAVHRLACTRYPDALRALADNLEHRTRPLRLERTLTWTAPTATAAWLVPAMGHLLAHQARHIAETHDAHQRLLPGQWADHRGLRYYAAGHTTFRDLAHQDLGVDISAPFLDNTLVRATLAAPSWTRADAHRFKPTLRQAMTGVLPSGVWERESKDAFTTHAYQGLRHNASAIRDLLTTAYLGELGVIETAPVLAALDRAVDGRTAPLGALAQIITTEMWMRSLKDEPTWWPHTHRTATVGERP
ncbi:albusnodin/ikarugamycin family macrolactam cyclase [Nocardiopsis sp. ATB16-24]|uniref:albusnodin/ikarugamycin family macrolactam cyclase n=1 Tax=Nocardiopsis sp. ATB16-24 TaxID=3019555 RepID=UPI002555C96A|nr:albusnodin/ikarugamycin family macrolactam cyclase [Nocardiopsis sp. ATB16-24]